MLSAAFGVAGCVFLLRAVFCVGTVFLVATLIVYGSPLSYFVLATFFAISTLRLTGHFVARGLRYRYSKKLRYKFWLRAHVHVG